MPWRETQSVAHREQFIDEVQRGRMKVLTLCAHSGVSRKTGYKWIARAREDGPTAQLIGPRRNRPPTVTAVPTALEPHERVSGHAVARQPGRRA